MTTPARARGALALGLVGFAAVRLRGQCEPYVALHRWLRDAGVPDAVRNLDGFALTALLAFATAAIAGGWRRALSEQTDWPAHAGANGQRSRGGRRRGLRRAAEPSPPRPQRRQPRRRHDHHPGGPARTSVRVIAARVSGHRGRGGSPARQLQRPQAQDDASTPSGSDRSLQLTRAVRLTWIRCAWRDGRRTPAGTTRS